MTTRKLTHNEIRIRILPTHLRWPDAGTSAVWIKAHDCVNALQDLRRAEICDRALRKLVNFPAFEIAEKALIESIDELDINRARCRDQLAPIVGPGLQRPSVRRDRQPAIAEPAHRKDVWQRRFHLENVGISVIRCK